MYLYNVSIKIFPQIREQWIAWMQDEHIEDVLNTGLFLDAEFCELLEPKDEEGFTFSVKYRTESIEKYQQYIDQYAPILREKAFKAFGDKFIAFRTLMKVL